MVALTAIGVACGFASLAWQIHSHFAPAPEIVDCYLEVSFREPERRHFDFYLVVRNLGVTNVFLRGIMFDGEVLFDYSDPLLQEPVRPSEERRFNVGSCPDTEIDEWADRIDRLVEDRLTFIETTRDTKIQVEMKMAQVTLDLKGMLRQLRGIEEAVSDGQ